MLKPRKSQKTNVYNLIVQGYSEHEIADKLGISVKTVKFHKTKIYSKFKVRSAVQLTAKHFESTILQLNSQIDTLNSKIKDIETKNNAILPVGGSSFLNKVR